MEDNEGCGIVVFIIVAAIVLRVIYKILAH